MNAEGVLIPVVRTVRPSYGRPSVNRNLSLHSGCSSLILNTHNLITSLVLALLTDVIRQLTDDPTDSDTESRRRSAFRGES